MYNLLLMYGAQCGNLAMLFSIPYLNLRINSPFYTQHCIGRMFHMYLHINVSSYAAIFLCFSLDRSGEYGVHPK